MNYKKEMLPQFSMGKDMNKICPLCGEAYSEPPAYSRADNKTMICPVCGTREALQRAGVSTEDQEKIIATMRQQRNITDMDGKNRKKDDYYDFCYTRVDGEGEPLARIPVSYFRHLTGNMAGYGSCFEEFMADTGYPETYKLISEDYNVLMTCLEDLYELANMTPADLFRTCDITEKTAADELHIPIEQVRDILSGKAELSEDMRCTLLTNHPVSSIVPDFRDDRGYEEIFYSVVEQIGLE